MGSVLFRRCPPPKLFQPAAADFYLMLEYSGREITQQSRDVSVSVIMTSDSQVQYGFKINGRVCLPLIVLPTVSWAVEPVSGILEIFTFSHLVLGGVSVLNMLRGGGQGANVLTGPLVEFLDFIL